MLENKDRKYSEEAGDLSVAGEGHGNLGIQGSQRGLQSGRLQLHVSGQARAHRKPRAWLARAEGKFQSPEAGPGGHHSVFSLDFLKQTITKTYSENTNKNHR